MTEKRYLLKYSEYETSNGEIIQAEPYFIDTKEEYVDEVYFTIDGYPTMSDEQVLDLLNENEQLKSDNKKYIKGLDLAKATSQSWASDVRELREENCRLEKKNERLIKKIKRERASTTKQHLKWSEQVEERIKELEKENEQLKETIKEVHDLLVEEVDVFTDKATEHDVCAYVELGQLDNKDAYYMAVSTKKAIKMLKGDLE